MEAESAHKTRTKTARSARSAGSGSVSKETVRRQASRFAALGHEARLRILRELLAHHPHGRVAGELQHTLDIPASTLSHHLDALRQEGLITQQREGRFLRYVADTAGLRELLDFLYAECCTRNPVIPISSLTA